MEGINEYCIAWSHPALRALLWFLSCPIHSPLNIELSEAPAFFFIARELHVSVPGISATFERYLNCSNKAFDKDLFESPHFPSRDIIQVKEHSYRVLPAASVIYNSD